MKAKIEKIAGLVWELNQTGGFDLDCDVSIRGVQIISYCEDSKASWYHPDKGIISGHNEMYISDKSFEIDLDQCISYLQTLLEKNKK